MLQCCIDASAVASNPAGEGSEDRLGGAVSSDASTAAAPAASLPELRAYAIAASVFHQLLVRSLRPLLVVSAIATLGEQAVGFATFALLAVFGATPPPPALPAQPCRLRCARRHTQPLAHGAQACRPAAGSHL